MKNSFVLTVNLAAEGQILPSGAIAVRGYAYSQSTNAEGKNYRRSFKFYIKEGVNYYTKNLRSAELYQFEGYVSSRTVKAYRQLPDGTMKEFTFDEPLFIVKNVVPLFAKPANNLLVWTDFRPAKVEPVAVEVPKKTTRAKKVTA